MLLAIEKSMVLASVPASVTDTVEATAPDAVVATCGFEYAYGFTAEGAVLGSVWEFDERAEERRGGQAWKIRGPP